MRGIRDLNIRGEGGWSQSTPTATRFAQCFCIALIVLIAPFGPAQASLTFCNDLTGPVNVAFAYLLKDAPGTNTGGERAATTEGCTAIAAGKCARVSEVDSKAVWLYYYAYTKNSRSSGSSMLCIKESIFKVDQPFGRRCPAGWTSVGFVRFESTATHYTFHIHM